MTATTPTIAPCERCQLTRPVWPYIPRHEGHGGNEPALLDCEWCMASEQGRPQPLLCVGCTQREAAEESGHPINERQAS